MDWFRNVFKDVIMAIGGSTICIIILLKFFKSRIEKWIDSEMELRCSKALIDYEAKLEKRKLYSEEKTKNELKAFNVMIELYEKIWFNFNVCTGIIDINIIQNNQATSTLTMNTKFLRAFDIVKDQYDILIQKEAGFLVYLPSNFNENIKYTEKKIFEWCTFVEQSAGVYDIDDSTRIALIHLNSDIKTNLLQSLSIAKKEIDLRAI